MSDLRKRLCQAFNRKEEVRWGYDEESMLIETAKRSECLEELAEILAIRGIRARYFPHSLSSLLQNWGKNLDAARNPYAFREPTPPKPDPSTKHAAYEHVKPKIIKTL